MLNPGNTPGILLKKALLFGLVLLLISSLNPGATLAIETGQATPALTPLPTPTVSPTARPTTPARVTAAARPPTANRNLTPAVTAGPVPTITPTPGPKYQPKPPAIRAASAIVVDADTGRILYAKNAHNQAPMASTTKIMTALTLLNIFPTMNDLQAYTTVVQDDLVGEANMNLRAGERIKLSTLLLGLMTNSANEAGMSLARYAGQRLTGPANPLDRFVAAMNARALSLGMYESHYMNPHGLDQPDHYSSAYDLAISGWYALRNPLLVSFFQFKGGTVDAHDFYNVNSFLTRYPGATGVKPGWTDEAGRCWVASASNNGHNVIVVVMNSPMPPNDIDPLMDYGFTVLAGRAEQATAALNLGWLNIPVAVQARQAGLKDLETAFRRQLEFTLQVAASVTAP